MRYNVCTRCPMPCAGRTNEGDEDMWPLSVWAEWGAWWMSQALVAASPLKQMWAVNPSATTQRAASSGSQSFPTLSTLMRLARETTEDTYHHAI